MARHIAGEILAYPQGDRREPPRWGDTLEQERGEVLKSVLEVIGNDHPDPDLTAACSFLIRHLAGTAAIRTSAIGARH